MPDDHGGELWYLKKQGAKPQKSPLNYDEEPLLVWLRMYIEGEHFSPEKLSVAATLSPSNVRRWCRTGAPPSIRDFRKVANILGYDLAIKRIKDPAGR